MASERARIIIELPPQCLSPNNPPATRGSRMRKAAATKRQRRLAREACEELQIETGPWQLARIDAIFYYKQKRRRDMFNYMAMLKGAIDGLVDAGLLADDHDEIVVGGGGRSEVDRAAPRVEVTVTRLDVEDAPARESSRSS